MKRLIATILFSLVLGGCGGNDYDEDDAYEDGYEATAPQSDDQYDVWCQCLRDAIKNGDQPKAKWNNSGCGT